MRVKMFFRPVRLPNAYSAGEAPVFVSDSEYAISEFRVSDAANMTGIREYSCDVLHNFRRPSHTWM